MKQYICDICGKGFDPKAPGANKSESPLPASGLLGIAASALDVCPCCMEKGRSIDFKSALIDTWRWEVETDDDSASVDV